jgi:hypothetical protein
MAEVVGYILAAAYLGLAGFFLARFLFYMLSAAADRRDKSILGTIDPFTRYSKANYSADDCTR